MALEAAVANHRGAEKTIVYSLGKTETCAIGDFEPLATDRLKSWIIETRSIEMSVSRLIYLMKEKMGEGYNRYKVAKTFGGNPIGCFETRSEI